MQFQKQILFLIVSLLAITAYAQTIPSQSERWQINKNIWSYANAKSGKPLLDFDAIDNWSCFYSQEPIISPNGEYFVYGIQNNLKNRLDTLILQSTINNWRTLLPIDAEPGFFSADSKQYIFQDKTGLCFLKTGTGERRYEKEIESYKTDEKKQWLSLQLKNNEKTLVLQNLITGKEKRVNGVVGSVFQGSGPWFTYQLQNKQLVLQNLISGKEVKYSNISTYTFDGLGGWFVAQPDDSSKELILYNLKNFSEQRFPSVQSYQFFAVNYFSTGDYLLLFTGKGLDYLNSMEAKRTEIWSSNDTSTTISGTAFDATGKQIIFITGSGESKAIWYWKEGMGKAELKVNNQMAGIKKDVLIQDGANFTDNGKYIQFSLQTSSALPPKPLKDAILLDVFSYQDAIGKSVQRNVTGTKISSAILNLKTGEVMLPEKKSEKLDWTKGDYALINRSGADVHGNRFWEEGYYQDSVWLLSLQTGVRILLPVTRSYQSPYFSPDGRYLLYFDAAKGCNYYSLELQTGKLVNISQGVPNWQLGNQTPFVRTIEKPLSGSGIKLWLEENNGLLVYDNYGDIWQLDPSGKKSAISITNGLGRLHNISFKLLNLHGDDQSFIGKDTLLLSAFNRKNKWQGFYRKVLGIKGDPELLSMAPCYMDLRDGENGQYPVKADGANTWIVKRESASEATNYFVTHDFRTFRQLTSLKPHKNYNWLTAELHSFKQLDGTISQGVLYKPENFDPTKKYPLIINFYGTFSQQIHKYMDPDYITRPNIFGAPAWMVSHGYLVFLPDIYFTKGQWGPSALNSVDGAARYLSQFSYVDKEHIALAGHSNSGRMAYYVLTHSKSFAAMSIGGATTNAISLALSKDLELFEVTSFGTGLGGLYQNKSSWIDQTSVLSADNVSAPLLMMHNKKDPVPIEQAVQMFTALRRLNKKVWWLQYDNGGHVLERDDAIDFTIRYTQFFDHYLKNAPAPRWMTQGIPNNLKGIEARYELDPAGSCAMQGKNHCYVCEAWNKTYKSDTAMLRKPISEWKLDKDIKNDLDEKEKQRYDENRNDEAQSIKENNEKVKGTSKRNH